MKNFLKTLFEEFPELAKDREKIEKMVYFLDKNKPSINVDKKFKKDLRNRIANYSKLKSRKKTNFLVFLTPIFSLFIAVFGFIYFSDDIFILDNQEKTLLDNVSQEQIQPMMMRTSMPVKEKVNDWHNVNEVIQEEPNNTINQDLKTKSVVDTDMTISGFDSNVWWSWPNDKDINKNDSIESFSTFSVEQKSDFEEYCESIDWEFLVDIDDKNYCLYKDKKCYEDNFNDWTCDNF